MNLLDKGLKPVRVYRYNKNHPMISEWPLDKRVSYILKRYRDSMGYEFDIRSPRSFTEKIQWYEIFYDFPGIEYLVYKYLFKDYIKRKLGEGYTIPLYDAWDNIKDFRSAYAGLPNQFVLKSTIQGDGKYVKIIRDKSKIDYHELEKLMQGWLDPRNTLINSLCRAYYRTKPRILAEEYMEQVDNQMYDYKVFCFDGVPYCFYVATDHFPGQLSHISFYDLDWNRMDVQYGEHPKSDVEKPMHFDEILSIAKELSKGFPFIRVDFFEVGDRVYVAELTLYPGGGKTPYHPESFNRELGDMFHLENCHSEVYDEYLSKILR